MMIKTELFESRSKILSPDFSYIYKHLFVQTIDDWLAFIVIIIVIIHSFSHSLLLLLLFVLSEVICIVGRYLTITNLLAAIVCDAMLCSLHCTTLLLAPITKNYYHYVCRQRRGYFFFFFALFSDSIQIDAIISVRPSAKPHFYSAPADHNNIFSHHSTMTSSLYCLLLLFLHQQKHQPHKN